MTLGEKIRKLRLDANLSQSQLAAELSVSRAAIARWENEHGTPDIGNLTALAAYFHVEVDALLNEAENIEFSKRTETVNPEDYEITGRCRNQYDAMIIRKFPDALRISPATLIYEFNKAERVVNFFTCGLLKCIWQITHWKAYTGIYYFVDTFEQQYLVQIEGSKMITTPLTYRTRNMVGEFYVGNRKFLDLHYELTKNDD